MSCQLEIIWYFCAVLVFLPVLTELIMAFLCFLWKVFTILSPMLVVNSLKLKS